MLCNLQATQQLDSDVCHCWAEQAGSFIRSQGGVVTAEQLAPFLVVSQSELPAPGFNWMEESFVWPALDRFRGEPVVDVESRGILYHFQDFQSSAQVQRRDLTGVHGANPSTQFDL